MKILPMRNLPPIRDGSPEVVQILDRIRFELDNRDSKHFDEDHAEFTWFAREYPRCYRYHLDCADFRLKTIWDLYSEIHSEMCRERRWGSEPNPAENGTLVQVAVGNKKVQRVYWDFESFLSEINIALDLLARIVGTAFIDEMPVSFNRFCKKDGSQRLLAIFKEAQSRWVRQLKDYRDCFIHYTPVDTLLSLSFVLNGDAFELRGKLPINPNVREMLGFKFSKRVELLKYACTVHRHMNALDRAVAADIARAFDAGEYPKRLSNLFFVGRRERKEA
jgi:hypothetical protein